MGKWTLNSIKNMALPSFFQFVKTLNSCSCSPASLQHFQHSVVCRFNKQPLFSIIQVISENAEKQQNKTDPCASPLHASFQSWQWSTNKYSPSIVFHSSHSSFPKAMFSYLAFKIMMWSKFQKAVLKIYDIHCSLLYSVILCCHTRWSGWFDLICFW